MARIGNADGGFLDRVLPPVGGKRINTPIWDETRSMFITEQYQSDAGNRYYLGLRLTNRFMTILHIGHYHSWTYINEVELYVFDGNNKVLAGKEKLDVFYDEDLIRNTTENLLKNYLLSQMKLCGIRNDGSSLDSDVKSLVGQSYCSMLNDEKVLMHFREVIPMLNIGKIC